MVRGCGRPSDEAIGTVSQAAPGARVWIPIAHAAERLRGLESRRDATGRSLRLAWSGNGTALYVAEGGTP